MAKHKRRVVFFVEPDWAFGSIHYGLCKYLWAYDIDCRVLPWNRQYDTQEFIDCLPTVDLVVSIPSAVRALSSYGVPPAKLVLVAHGTYDIDIYRNDPCIDVDACTGYAVTSHHLAAYSKACGIGRTPMLASVGINTNTFYQPVSKLLTRVGYAGSWGNGHPLELKRPQLTDCAAQQAGLEFHAAVWRQHSVVTMPGWYGSVGAVMIASTNEGAGLPALEAGAAGRLVLSTPVGHWPERVGNAGGITLPFDADAYVEEATAHLVFYKHNPEAYRQKCQQIQEHAQSYDWSKVIHEWVELLG